MKIEMANLERPELHELIGSSISPLPIALISTIGEDGVYNAAPYSLVIPVCWKPPILCVSFGLKRGQKKDTLRNLEFSGDFVVNIMGETFIKPTILSSANYPSSVDEIEKVGLTAIAADKVKSPRIVEAQISLECQLVQKLGLGEGDNLRDIIFGEVVLGHVKDGLCVDGRIEPSRLRAVGRLGSKSYCRTGDIMEGALPAVGTGQENP